MCHLTAVIFNPYRPRNKWCSYSSSHQRQGPRSHAGGHDNASPAGGRSNHQAPGAGGVRVKLRDHGRGGNDEETTPSAGETGEEEEEEASTD